MPSSSSRQKSKHFRDDHFTVMVVDNTDRRFCNHCQSSFSLSTSSSILSKHLANIHNIYVGDRIPPSLETQSILPFASPHSPIQQKLTKAQQSFLRVLINEYIIDGCHPFSEVERPSFRKIINWLCPNYEEIGRNTVQRDIVLLYKEKQESIGNELEVMIDNSLLNFTLDIWTSKGGTPFLGVTVHYIDKNFGLKTKTLDCG
ncbi:hypothetical protein GEMRC1_002470 [Eukaryota sp. GEM-RC1]